MKPKLYLFVILGILFAAVDVFAQAGKNLPEIAPHEVARRGNHVEMTGTIRSGLMAQALAPPEDDSAKWFITLIVRPGDANCDVMRHVIETDKAIKPWIDASDPAKSTTHYHVRRIDDPTQADWLAGLKSLDPNKLPCIVLQPPRNGQFGSSAVVVKLIQGKNTGKELADKLREAVVNYVKAIEQPAQGIASPEAPKEIAVAPPFQVPPVMPPPVAPVSPSLPLDWPPSAPQALTTEQVRQAVPEADADFILKTIDSKETNIEIVKLKWIVSHPIKPPAPVAPVVEPVAPVVAPYIEPERESEPIDKPSFHSGHPGAYCLTAMAVCLAVGFLLAGAVKWVHAKAVSFASFIDGIKTAASQAQARQTIQVTATPIQPQPQPIQPAKIVTPIVQPTVQPVATIAP